MTAAAYRAIRESLGTQSFVAELLDVARSTVADRERGAMAITTEAALAISYFKLSVQHSEIMVDR